MRLPQGKGSCSALLAQSTQPELQEGSFMFILHKHLLHVILDQVISHPAVMREERGKRPSSREKAGYWDGEAAVPVGADCVSLGDNRLWVTVKQSPPQTAL